jgi:hypothetical protein
MTDVQDAILDRLVGAKIGVDWPDGPLALAAEAVGGHRPVLFCFGGSSFDRDAKSEVVRRLGYPMLLLEAIQGGNQAFAAEDDRRAFAMEVFRTVFVGAMPAQLRFVDQGRVAGRLAVRTHAYACSLECPVPRGLADLMGAPGPTPELVELALGARCLMPKADDEGVGDLTEQEAQLMLLTKPTDLAVYGMWHKRDAYLWYSVGESVRLAATGRGIEEAVDCCAEVARAFGLPVVG